jgi:AcrR family transcriptional regulator
MPKKMLSTKDPIRKPGVERHREIIEAAETLIRGGISPRDLTLQAVATRADVPRVSLYYFFSSIEALLEVLYQRALNKMIGELGEIPEASEWRVFIDSLLDQTRKFYNTNPLEMALVLSPSSFSISNQTNKDYAQVLYKIMVNMIGLPRPQKLHQACDIGIEIAHAVWRKSFVEKGKVTAALHTQAKKAVLSYLESVIEQTERDN